MKTEAALAAVAHLPKDTQDRHFDAPRYRGKDYVWVVNILRYVGFCQDMDSSIEDAFVNRVMADRAWDELLAKKWKEWDTKEAEERGDEVCVMIYREGLSALAQRQVCYVTQYQKYSQDIC
jgi:hypothetical protein